MSSNTAIETRTTRTNGVGVDQIMDVIGQIEADADNAKFQFRARNAWIDGGLSRTEIGDYFAAGRERRSANRRFVLDADMPALMAGFDSAPAAVEHLLHALAGCLTATLVYHAAVQGIEVAGVESSYEGDIDVRGILGLSDDVRKGFGAIRVRMRVRSDAPAEQLRELALYSPVYEMISRSVPCELVLETW